MASSQDIAKWVETHLESSNCQNLSDAILHALKKSIPNTSIEFQTDLAEEHLVYVEEILRNRSALLTEDGGIPAYKLDDKELYICRINQQNTKIAAKLRLIDPYFFEVVCKRILEKLGGTAENTKKTYDGGVDFFALNLTTYSASYPCLKLPPYL